MSALSPRQRLRQIDDEIARGTIVFETKRAEANAILAALHDADMEIRDTVDAAHRIVWVVDRDLVAMDAPLDVASTYRHDRLPLLRPYRQRLDELRAAVAPKRTAYRRAKADAEDAETDLRRLRAERMEILEAMEGRK